MKPQLRLQEVTEPLERVVASAAPQELPEPGIVETPSYKRFYRGVEYAHQGNFVLEYGGAGIGKTTALKAYARAHWDWEQGRAHYIDLLGVTTPTSMLHTIAEDIGAHSALGAYRNASIMRDLARQLRDRDCLILDESQGLRADALDMIRFFGDTSGVGVVLSGNTRVFNAISGKSRRANFAQIHSRVSLRIFVPHPTEGDADAIMAAWGVTDSGAREYGREIALGIGGLRHLIHAIRRARLWAAGKKRPLDHRAMHEASTGLRVDGDD